jgi:hypothetical protein
MLFSEQDVIIGVVRLPAVYEALDLSEGNVREKIPIKVVNQTVESLKRQLFDSHDEKGWLVLLDAEGCDLASMDGNGFSDPYLRIRLPGVPEWKSSVCKKTLNPKWSFTQLKKKKQFFCVPTLGVNDSFKTALAPNLNSVNSVRVEVWDNDLVGSDFMGGIDLHLELIRSVCMASFTKSAWFEFHTLDTKSEFKEGVSNPNVRGVIRLNFMCDTWDALHK